MKFRIWLGTAVLSTMLIAVACQSGESPLAGGERVVTTADYLSDPYTNDDIAAALDTCNDDGTGQGTAAKTRFENAIRKLLNGDTAGAQSDIIGLLSWEYDRYDIGKWQCSDEDFVEIMEAMVGAVGLNIPIGLDGCVCLTDGCTCISNTDCAGVVLPNPGGEVYFVSFTTIPFDPFVATPDGFNLYDQWADFQVVDINGQPVTFSGDPAQVAVFVQDLQTNFVTEGQLQLGHVKDGVMQILPPNTVTFQLSCTSSGVTSSTFFDQVASIFQVTPLYAAGTKSGLLSSFSPVGPLDPHSDTRVGISPTGVQLTDGQSQIFTATVEGVKAFDTAGGEYEPTDLELGSPIEFYLDDGTEPFALGAIDANGQASLSLTCGSGLTPGEHVIRLVYPATETHAASSTADDDSPTGSATVTCTTPFNVINFDRDPNGNPLKNGEIVNETYAALGVRFSHVISPNATACLNSNVFAVSDPNTGHFGSPPRVVSLCETSSAFGSTTHGWVKASFDQDQSEVCIAVFPTAGKGKNVPQGKIVAYALNGATIGSSSGQGKQVCVAKRRNDPYIRSVQFSGDGELAKFDNLRYR